MCARAVVLHTIQCMGVGGRAAKRRGIMRLNAVAPHKKIVSLVLNVMFITEIVTRGPYGNSKDWLILPY